MNEHRLTAWQSISTHRLSKAAVVVKRNTSPLVGRRPSDPHWWEWDIAMRQALAFGVDPMTAMEMKR